MSFDTRGGRGQGAKAPQKEEDDSAEGINLTLLGKTIVVARGLGLAVALGGVLLLARYS